MEFPGPSGVTSKSSKPHTEYYLPWLFKPSYVYRKVCAGVDRVDLFTRLVDRVGTGTYLGYGLSVAYHGIVGGCISYYIERMWAMDGEDQAQIMQAVLVGLFYVLPMRQALVPVSRSYWASMMKLCGILVGVSVLWQNRYLWARVYEEGAEVSVDEQFLAKLGAIAVKVFFYLSSQNTLDRLNEGFKKHSSTSMDQIYGLLVDKNIAVWAIAYLVKK